MNINKLLLLVVLAALLLFSLSAGTLAYFSSEAVSSGNIINAGTLYIGGEDGSKGVLSEFVNLEGMVPGAEPQEVTVKVKNLGTMEAYINSISVNIEENDEKFLANALAAKFYDADRNVLFSGSLLALDNTVVPLVPLNEEIVLEPEEVIEFALAVQLDERVSNWYKGKGIEFSIALYAGQKPGQQVGERVIVTNENNAQDDIDGATAGDTVLLSSGRYEHLKVKPGIVVKAKDVVFDTVLDEVEVKGSVRHDIPARIQGFTINGTQYGVSVNINGECWVTDSIFNPNNSPLIVKGNSKVQLTRNDFTSSDNYTPGGKVDARYNLGLDLNPEDHAL